MLRTALPTAGRKETDETLEALTKLIDTMIAQVSQVLFGRASYSPAAGLLTTAETVETADGNDVTIPFGENAIRRVQVDVTGGGAAGGEIQGTDGEWDATAVIVIVEDGVGAFNTRATGTGTLILGITDVDSTGHTYSDTLTITFN